MMKYKYKMKCEGIKKDSKMFVKKISKPYKKEMKDELVEEKKVRELI